MTKLTQKTTLKNILLRPIPDQQLAAERKAGYRHYPLLSSHDKNSETLVDIASYGVAGQSYYSRTNAATGPLPEVEAVVFLRSHIVKQLAEINHALNGSALAAEVFGGQVELYVQEGLRSRTTQRLQSAKSPSPHATGAAFDVTLRYIDPDLGYQAKRTIDMGHVRLSDNAAFPDFYETVNRRLTSQEEQAARHRRAFYWIMRGALLSTGDSGFMCNPTEWWHWSYGDQMWAALTEAPFAFYAAAEQPSLMAPPQS